MKKFLCFLVLSFFVFCVFANASESEVESTTIPGPTTCTVVGNVSIELKHYSFGYVVRASNRNSYKVNISYSVFAYNVETKRQEKIAGGTFALNAQGSNGDCDEQDLYFDSELYKNPYVEPGYPESCK